MPSATQVITRSYRITGVTGQSETLTAQELDDGLVALNDMIDSWNLSRSFIYAIDSETFNLVSGQHSYTIGTSGDFNTARPIKIDNLVINQGDSVWPLTSISAEDYADLSNKDVDIGIPKYYYIDDDFPLATIYLYGAPQANLTLTIGKWEAVNQFADLTTQYTFPPGYNRALNYGLAMEIAPENGMQLSPEAKDIARRAIAQVKNKNLPKRTMTTEISLLNRHRGDIFIGR